MKYLKFVFENEEVCNLTDINQPLIEVATQAAIYNSISIEEDILNNLDAFISSESALVDVYESIKDYTISKSIEFYDLVNEIISDPVLTIDQKAVVLSEVEAVIPAVIPPTSMEIAIKALADEKALAAAKYHAAIADLGANPSHAALAALTAAGVGAAAYHGINKYRNRNNL